MAKEKKSIVDEALLDIKRIQEALEANTKEILRSTAKEEIDSIVESALAEADYEEEDMEDDAVAVDANAEDEMSDYEDSEEVEVDADMGGGDSEMGDDYEDGMDTEMSYDSDMDMTSASDSEVIAVYKKLSGDDEIEVVSDNEIHITDKDSGNEYHIKLNGDMSAGMDADMGAGMDAMDYEGGEAEAEDEMEMDYEEEGMTYEGKKAGDDVVYEIALDEEDEVVTEEDGKVRTATSDVHMGSEKSAPNTGDIEGQTSPEDNETSGDNLEGGFKGKEATKNDVGHADHVMNEDDEVVENEEITEDDEVTEEVVDENLASTRGYAGRQGAKMGGDDHHPSRKDESKLRNKYNALAENYNKLKKENGEFKAALKKFRTMLAETVVFNSNLTYVTKLFMEHTTTKDEKQNILTRFDNDVANLKESKKLYRTIAGELNTKKPISESVESKINETKISSKSNLSESTVYVDRDASRINDLIRRVERR